MFYQADPFGLLHQLEEAGFTRAQAEVQVRLMLAIAESRAPTQEDLKKMRLRYARELRALEIRVRGEVQQLKEQLQSQTDILGGEIEKLRLETQKVQGEVEKLRIEMHQMEVRLVHVGREETRKIILWVAGLMIGQATLLLTLGKLFKVFQ